MSNLSITVPFSSGQPVTHQNEIFVDPNNSNATGPVVAIIQSDGTLLGPGGSPSPVSLSSQSYTSQITITRPNNTTAYTANDVLGGALTITTIGPTSGAVIITGTDLLPKISSVPSGMTSFRLYLYSATPPSAIADNGPWTFTSTDWGVYLGYVDLGTPVNLGAGLFVQTDNINKKVLLGASTSLFGYLVTNGGFTPAGNSEVYLLRLQTLGC